jgi:hypothetical protein
MVATLLSIFEWTLNQLLSSVPDGRPDIDLQQSVQIRGEDLSQAINNIELGDYIQWNETSGQPGDKWYCGRTCYGVVDRITDLGFRVIGIGYYGAYNQVLFCPRTSYQSGYAPSNNGIDCIVKRDNIVWRPNP